MIGAVSPPLSERMRFSVRPGAGAVGIAESADGLTLEVPMERLAGPDEEVLPAPGARIRREGGFRLLDDGRSLFGAVAGMPGEPPEAAANRLYRDILQICGSRRLYRVWNYIPAINEEPDGFENYRAFNRGRRNAFHARFGADFARHLPAASALGIEGDRMAVAFAAGSAAPRHFENPEQTCSWDYPDEFGPVPPAFARGTAVATPDYRIWYLSGTASIKGHETKGTRFDEQFRLALDNVRLMFGRMGVPDSACPAWKIFLRRREDLAACREAFARAFPGHEAGTMFLRTDICRSCLLVEVEAAIHLPVARQPAAAAVTSADLSVS